MKNASPSFLLSVASLLATFTALGAANPEIAAVNGAAAAAAKEVSRAIDRASATVVDEPRTQPLPRVESAGYSGSRINPDEIVFAFKPPKTTRRADHADDLDLVSFLEKDASRKAELDGIGQALVDFVDSRHRVLTNQAEKLKVFLDERGKAKDESFDAMVRAQDAQKDAMVAYLGEKEKENRAKDAVAVAQQKADEAARTVEEIMGRQKESVEDAGKLKQEREKFQKGLADASVAEHEALAKRDQAKAKADEAGRTLASAESDLSTKKAMLAERRNEERKAQDALPVLAGKVAEADRALVGAEAARKAAESARKAAKGEKADADRAVSAAERRLRNAEKDLVRSTNGVAKALAAVAGAKTAKTVAEARLAEARARDAATTNWFSRLFIPSVSRAERRVGKADAAIEFAERTAKDARAAVESAKSEVKKAGDGRDAAVKEAAARGAALDAAGRKVEEAGKNVETRAAEVRGARLDERAGKKTAENAKRAAAEAQTAERRAEKARADASVALTNAAAEAAASAETWKARNDDFVAKQKRNRELEEAESAADQFAILHQDEKDAAEVRQIRALDEVDKAQKELEKISAEDIEAARLRTEAANRSAEGAVRDFRRAEAEFESADRDAFDAAARDELELDSSNKARYDEFWKAFRTDALAQAVKGPDAAADKSEKARKDSEAKAAEAENALVAARGGVGRAQTGLKAAEDAAKKAKADLDAAERNARAVDKEGERAFARAKAAHDEAVKALAKADQALAKAKEGGDLAVVSAAMKTVEAARSAEASAKEALDAVPAANEKAAAKAGDDVGKAREALAAAAGEVEKARTGLAKAVERREGAEAGEAAARRNLREAERARQAAVEARASTEHDVNRAVDVLKDAFDEQVAKMQRLKRAAIDRAGRSESWTRRDLAHRARREFLRTRKEYEAARVEVEELRTDLSRDESLKWWEAPDYVEARADLKDKRKAFEAAEDEYNKYYPDASTYRTANLSDEEADARLAEPDVLLALQGYQIAGDRRWFVRTSVNGIPLLESFADEMEDRAEELADAGTPGVVRDENGRVSFTDKADPKDVRRCAAAAAEYAQRRAINAGFYFAGLLAGDWTERDGGYILVDKGRFGQTSVEFAGSGTNAVDTAAAGRLFDATNIVAKLFPDIAPTNALEGGQAFNFSDFRRRFNALNANPDVEKADVAFELQPSLDYGYEDEDEGRLWTNSVPKYSRGAVKANVKVKEAGFPAPLHGTIGVDNFNSLGDSDVPFATEAFAARITLQTLDLWGLGHALTASGSSTFDGSLWGVAGSYFIPRREDESWADGSWHRLSGWSWTAHGGYTDVNQEGVIENDDARLDVLGNGYYFGLQAASRLADFGASTLDLSLGLTYRYVENSLEILQGGVTYPIDMGPDGDGYTIVPLSVALMYADKDLDDLRGRNYATVELAYNLAGSSDEDLVYFRQAIDDRNYAILRAQLARIQLMFEDSRSFWLPRLLFLRLDGQYSSTAVVGAEQFGLGGHGTVRGYAERQFMGDRGFSGTLEFRTPIGLGLFDTTGESAYRASDRLQLVYFLDFGWFWLEDGLGSRGDDSEAIYSLGLGLRYSWDDLVLRFDWGVPLVRGGDNDDFQTSSAGVGHLSFTYQF